MMMQPMAYTYCRIAFIFVLGDQHVMAGEVGSNLANHVVVPGGELEATDLCG